MAKASRVSIGDLPQALFGELEGLQAFFGYCGDLGGLASNAPWPMRARCVSGTGHSHIAAQGNVYEQWSANLGLTISTSPAIAADGTVYVGSDAGLFALDKKGQVRWSFDPPGLIDSVRSSPALAADGAVYFGSSNHFFYALDARSGELRWEVDLGGAINSSAVIAADGVIYVGSNDRRMYALDPVAGGVIWTYQTNGAIDSSPAIGPDGHLYFGSDDNHLYALKTDPALTEEERLIWATNLWGDVESSPTLGLGPDYPVYVGSEGNKLFKVNRATGVIEWDYPMGLNVDSSPSVGIDGVVFVGSDNGHLYAINPDGTKKWNKWLWGSVNSSPVIGADGVIYVGSDSGSLYALEADGGNELWSMYLLGGVRTAPAIGAAGKLYVGTAIGKLHAFRGTPRRCPAGQGCRTAFGQSYCAEEVTPPLCVEGSCPDGGSCYQVPNSEYEVCLQACTP